MISNADIQDRQSLPAWKISTQQHPQSRLHLFNLMLYIAKFSEYQVYNVDFLIFFMLVIIMLIKQLIFILYGFWKC